MPLRRPGTADSAVAAMAGDHGSRSSWPGLEKSRNEKRKAWEERGEYGDAHHGENRSGGGSVTVVRMEVSSSAMADPGDHGCGGCGLPRCLASAKTRAGSSWVRAGGLAPLNRGRGAGDAPTMREERAQFGGGCG